MIYDSNECQKDGYGTMIPAEDVPTKPEKLNPAPYIEPGVNVRFELQPMNTIIGVFNPDTCQAQVAMIFS